MQPLRLRSLAWSVWLLALVGLATSCVTSALNPFADITVKTGAPFIIAHGPEPMGWGYWTHPYMQIHEQGIIVGYNLAGDGGSMKRSDIRLYHDGPAYSFDGGKSWEVGYSNIVEEKRWLGVPCFGEIRGKNGSYWFHSSALSRQGFPCRWERNGQPEPVETALLSLPANYEAHVWPSTRGVELDDGTLLIPAFIRARGEKLFHTLLIASTNGGKAWFHYSVVATAEHAPWSQEGPCEPGMVRLSSGRLVCMMRTGGSSAESGLTRAQPMICAISDDLGKTWRIKKTSLAGVMPKLMVLQNGVIACAFGRPGNNLAFSSDEGESWGGVVGISSPTAPTSGYIDIVEVSKDRLLAVYDIMDSPLSSFWLWEPKYASAIKGMFVDVRRR